ncbi:MAG: pirin family protein [Euryarchaeota archaeon]|nr:pirin family protein [Euryarchaeota archaeon]MDE1835662.1 pirin family protein [Euryarchaeota archaeon]MDE1879010.1 pirin family protein [Euryarchaeota archaeon]MDE2043716.1 pirin family protein [Thermoplasmata archaeon]
MSEIVRPVQHILKAEDTLEGAGVRLKRAFGNGEVPLFDPFLLLDNFASTNPREYLAGFPWHPHRGIETVTYMLEGQVEHEDSLGNKGRIDGGDVQWMTSGSGILHQEMPQRKEGMLQGFQLWVNIPAKLKMGDPAYRGLTGGEIPRVQTDAASVKVVAGSFQNVEGPVRGLPVDPTYLDITLVPHAAFELPVKRGYTVFSYLVDGEARFEGRDTVVPTKRVVLLGDGDKVRLNAGRPGARLLLVSGRPLHEPVAWYGPIVMNTQEELSVAMRELRRGDFIKAREVAEV